MQVREDVLRIPVRRDHVSVDMLRSVKCMSVSSTKFLRVSTQFSFLNESVTTYQFKWQKVEFEWNWWRPHAVENFRC